LGGGGGGGAGGNGGAGGSGAVEDYTRKMVEAHNGKIQVDSALGQGSQFKITIPLLT
jgi:signal transduction histidine kinase